MIRRTLSGSGRIVALLAVGSLSAWGQGTQTASVTGSVIDAGDAAITGALVRLTSPSLQGARIVSTDAKGRFTARLLPPGDYLIEITKADYQTIQLNQRLGIDQNFQPRFRMAKRQSVVVEVVAAPPAMDKTDAKTASNYRMDRMDLLPVVRNMESIALLTPGVLAGVGGGVQVRGAMTSNNLILVDGQNVEDNCWGNRGVQLIDDAIEEMEVITGAISAEYGNVDGGVMNAITRSGSNVFSGQLRWNFQKPSWNATGPLIDQARVSDKLGGDLTFSLGGYLIKDRLWFFASCFKESFDEVRTISSDAIPCAPAWQQGAGSTYMYSRDETRRQLKLTWLMNPDHTLVASYMGSDNAESNVDARSGCLDTLIPQHRKDLLLNLAWRAIWSPQVITDIRYGIKRQALYGGPVGSRSPFVDYDSEEWLLYNQGMFNDADGGDHRDNRTFAAKASLFAEAHQLDVGFDWYRSSRRARNDQSSTGYIFGVEDIDPATQTATPVDVWVYSSKGGEATVENNALYVNDKWTLNEHLTFQMGLRWDRYEGRDEGGTTFAGAEGWSPRLGLKWDVLGDSKWIAGASYARYNGKVLESMLMGVTYQGHPQELDYWANTGASMSFTDICDLSNYDFSGAGCSFQYIPGVNVRMNRHMKAPGVDEYQTSLAYSFQDAPIGSGYIRATAVYKDWKNNIDYRVGSDGTASYTLPSGDTISTYIQVWDNTPDAKRNYRALELDFSTGEKPWQINGNLTWSRLWGNYQGEEEFAPGTGEGLHAWNPAGGVTFDRNLVAPEGYLRGHVPFRARIMGTYSMTSALGETTFGLMYRFDAGSRESETRNISASMLNPALPPDAEAFPFKQYRDSRRGTNRGNSSWYLDVSVNHEWNLFQAGKVPVRAFFKALIKNVLNHKQLLRTPKTYEAAVTSPSDPWVPDASYGVAGPDCYGEPRTYSFSTGVRF